MSEWYCRSGQIVQGPFSWAELIYLAQRGKLTARDQVRCGNSGTWVAAKSVSGLLDSLSTTPPKRASPAPVSSAKSLLPTPAGARGFSASNAKVPMSELPAPSVDPEPSVTVAIPARPRLEPRETEQEAQRRRIIIASILAGLALLAAIVLLIWVLWWSAVGGGAGSGASSQGGQGSVGEGSAEGEQESMLDGDDSGDAGNEAPESEPGGQDTAGMAPPPPPPAPTIGSPLADATAATSPNPDGKSRFSIGGSDFFGISASGNTFVYIVDCSGSMVGARFDMAKRELLRSIYSLDDDKSIFVIFFADGHYPMFNQNQALPSNLANKERIRQWVEPFGIQGGTKPDSAIDFALKMQPDAVYLLTDGEFDDSAVVLARASNSRKVPINTIGFQDRGGEPGLKQIANDSGGKYKFVP